MVRGCFVSFEKRETGGGSDPGRSCSAELSQCPEHLPPRENIPAPKSDLITGSYFKIYDFFIFRETFVNIPNRPIRVEKKCRHPREHPEAGPTGLSGPWAPWRASSRPLVARPLVPGPPLPSGANHSKSKPIKAPQNITFHKIIFFKKINHD